jgi:macrodomain Ter protein organizer (MatP/YcbG family)
MALILWHIEKTKKMTDQKYVIRQQDKHAAAGFLDNMIASDSCWLNKDASQRVIAELEYRAAKHNSIALNEWCTRWLDQTQWMQLKNAVRIARDQIESQKYRPQLKTISLTYHAWQILTELAKHDEATLSEVIINRLGDDLLNLPDDTESNSYNHKIRSYGNKST